MRRENVESFGWGGEVYIEEFVESAWTDHGWIDHVGAVGGANDVDCFTGVEAVELC